MIRSTLVRQFKRTMATDVRAVVYSAYGDPKDQLSVFKHKVQEPGENQVLLKLLAAPINPSDINQVEGIYPSRPPMTTDLGTAEPAAVGGNEGVFEVLKVGKNVTTLSVGDWALPAKAGFGTWRTHAVADAAVLNPLKDHSKITPLQAGTVSVNPTTAHQMLQEFADMQPGDWFIQNGANSGVGRAAIQLGRMSGLKSINVIRDRPNLDELKKELTDLGADHVITEDQLSDKAFRDTIKGWVGEGEIKLALNCVGGKSCTNLSRQLSPGGHIVTYGGMSKLPVTIGTGDYIFKDIHSHGYWLSGWAKKFPEKRYELILKLLQLIGDGKLKDVPVTEHVWKQDGSDEDFSTVFHTAMQNSRDSKGKQVIVLK